MFSSRSTFAVLATLFCGAAFIGCGGGGSGDGGAPPALSDANVKSIEENMTIKPFQLAKWGILAESTKDPDDVLYSKNIHRKFIGASTTKNFTVAATLGELGPDYRFETPVVRMGEVDSQGVLNDDLVLQASGDLTMGGRDLGDDKVDYVGFDHMDANEIPGPAELTPQDPLAGLDKLAKEVKDSGIDTISGDVKIDDRLWITKVIGREVISPIIINDNVIDVTVIPGEPGELATADLRPETSAYDVDIKVKTVAPGGAARPGGR